MDLRDNHPYLIGYHISNVGKIYSRVKGYWRKATASKLSNKDRISIVKSLNSGISIDTLSKRYKVSRACIRSQIRIVSNLRKQQ